MQDTDTVKDKIRAQIEAMVPLMSSFGFKKTRDADKEVVFLSRHTKPHAEFVCTPDKDGNLAVQIYCKGEDETEYRRIMVIQKIMIMRVIEAAIKGFDLVQGEDNGA